MLSFVNAKPKEKERNTHVMTSRTTHSSVRLGTALRVFAGGCPFDIALVHGVGHFEVHNSTWKVVEAAHNTPSLSMQFPECHQQQTEIASKFKAISAADFDNCAGHMDGLLTWITKPNEKEASVSSVGPKKFCVDVKANSA